MTVKITQMKLISNVNCFLTEIIADVTKTNLHINKRFYLSKYNNISNYCVVI